ncbi:MAG: GNAT family N-acetyltransferase, partial [Candidatus Thorarchaeota archaeon]
FGLQLTPFIKSPNFISNLELNESFAHKHNWIRFLRETKDITINKSNLIIKEVNDENFGNFCEILISAYETDPQAKKVMKGLIQSSKYINLLAYDNETPIATASIFLDDEMAWFGFAATDINHRNKGAQGVLIKHRLKLAKEHGCKFVTVETMEDTIKKRNPSYHNMIRYRFVNCYKRKNYIYYPLTKK